MAAGEDDVGHALSTDTCGAAITLDPGRLGCLSADAMKVGIPKEVEAQERRVAVSPASVKRLQRSEKRTVPL